MSDLRRIVTDAEAKVEHMRKADGTLDYDAWGQACLDYIDSTPLDEPAHWQAVRLFRLLDALICPLPR